MKSDSIKDFTELLLLISTQYCLQSIVHSWKSSRHDPVLKHMNQAFLMFVCIATHLNTISPVQLYHLLDWKRNDVKAKTG